MTQFFDLMIDTETAGLPHTGALLSIGACFFDLHTQTIGPTFNRTIHLASSVKHGGTMDPGTVLWWLRQDPKAQKGVAYNGEPIDLVLNDFSKWIAEHCRVEDVRPWGNGASFDLTIVSGAYKRLGIDEPWAFWNQRCFRTVRNQHPSVAYEPGEKGDDAHNALVDAIFQAQHMFKIKQSLMKAAQ